MTPEAKARLQIDHKLAQADRFLLKGAMLFALWYDMPQPSRHDRTDSTAHRLE